MPRSIPLLAALTLAGVWGCALDITRVRTNVPLRQDVYQKLEPGRTTETETLELLGAPDKLEHKGDPPLEYLWYLHQDSTRVGLRLESPITFFGYRHTIAEFDVDAEDTSSMRLVYGQDGILQLKSLRLAPAFEAPEVQKPGWGVYLLPRYGWSPLLWGDGGEKDYSTLFSKGQLYGGHVGILPAPYFMLLVGGNYQTYTGDAFNAGGSRVSLDDLRLYVLELGGRFELPPQFFIHFWDINRLKSLFYTDDINRHRGPFLYFQWTLGGAFNEDVGVKIDGIPSGSYFDRSVRFMTTLGAGVAYRLPRLGIMAGVDYQSIDGFASGNAPLDTDARSLQNLILSAGLSWKF